MLCLLKCQENYKVRIDLYIDFDRCNHSIQANHTHRFGMPPTMKWYKTKDTSTSDPILPNSQPHFVL